MYRYKYTNALDTVILVLLVCVYIDCETEGGESYTWLSQQPPALGGLWALVGENIFS